MPGSHFQVIQLLAIVKNVKTFKIRRDGPVCCRLRIPARPGAWPSDALQVQTRVTRASGARQKPSRWSRRLRVCLVVETEGLDLEGPLRGAGFRGAPKRQKWLQQHLFANTSEWPLSSCRPGPVALVSRSGSLSLCKIWCTQMLKFNNNHQSRVECLTKICVWKYFGRRSWSMAGILFSCMVTLCALDTLTGCLWIALTTERMCASFTLKLGVLNQQGTNLHVWIVRIENFVFAIKWVNFLLCWWPWMPQVERN